MVRNCDKITHEVIFLIKQIIYGFLLHKVFTNLFDAFDLKERKAVKVWVF